MGNPLRTELPGPGRVEGGWTVPAGGGGRPPILSPPHRTSLSCVECARGYEFHRSRPPGPSSPDREVRPPPSSFSGVWGGFPPGPGSPKPLSNTPEGLEADERTHSISVSGGTPLPLHPPLAGSFVPPAAGVSSRFLGEPLSRRPPGSGRPSFFPLSAAGPGVGSGCGNAETYRTPRRGKARPAQTSTAETLLCSSGGP